MSNTRDIRLDKLELLSNEDLERIIATLEVELRERHLGSNPAAMRLDNDIASYDDLRGL